MNITLGTQHGLKRWTDLANHQRHLEKELCWEPRGLPLPQPGALWRLGEGEPRQKRKTDSWHGMRRNVLSAK